MASISSLISVLDSEAWPPSRTVFDLTDALDLYEARDGVLDAFPTLLTSALSPALEPALEPALDPALEPAFEPAWDYFAEMGASAYVAIVLIALVLIDGFELNNTLLIISSIS